MKKRPHVSELDERMIFLRATEHLQNERIVHEEEIKITLVDRVGPEPWTVFFIEGKNIGGNDGGRILIGLSTDDPLAALAWSKEYGKKYVHHVWVDPEARRRGLADILFRLYKQRVSKTLYAAGPFSAGGLRAAERAGAKFI